MNYRVGQVLFLISQSNKVIPVQIIEEISKTTLAGKELTYNLVFPNAEKTVIDIKKVKGQLFNSKEEVKEYMLENTRNAINQLVNDADELCKQAFNVDLEKDDTENIEEFVETAIEQIEQIKTVQSKKKTNKEIIQDKQPIINDDIIKVDLGGGQIGRMKRSEAEKLGLATL